MIGCNSISYLTICFSMMLKNVIQNARIGYLLGSKFVTETSPSSVNVRPGTVMTKKQKTIELFMIALTSECHRRRVIGFKYNDWLRYTWRIHTAREKKKFKFHLVAILFSVLVCIWISLSFPPPLPRSTTNNTCKP